MYRDSCAPGNAGAARLNLHLRSVFADASQEPGWISLRVAIAVALVRTRDWRPWLADALTLLSADEAERVQRRRIATDRETLAIAYALHRLLLGRFLGVRHPGHVPLHRDERGCPRLAGDIAYTSLSHCDGLIAIAVTTSGPVGVDIEPRARGVVMAAIARCVCHSSEAAELALLDAPARAAALLAIWVRKEAVLKAAGVGLAVPMETFAAPVHPALMLPALSADAIQVRMLDAGDEWVAAVAGPPAIDVVCRPLGPPRGSAVANPPRRSRPGLDAACVPGATAP